MATVMVRDESAAGVVLSSFELEFPAERISVRELIRERVYQEVQDFERKVEERRGGGVHRLVSPGEVEVRLNGERGERRSPGYASGVSGQRAVDWKKQAEVAWEAFERNGFFVLVGNRQAETLDEVVEIGRGVEVSFVKLTPLVGG